VNYVLFIVRRLVTLIPVLFGISLVAFMLLHLIPGDPAVTLLGTHVTPEAVAALVNGLIVWLLPTAISALFAIGGFGASDTNTTVHADDWTPLDPIIATAVMFSAVMLPFAAVAAWRTWIHAKRRRELGTSGWRGVGEAGACGLVTVLVVLTPGIFRHPTLAAPYLLVYGAYAVFCGLLIGLLLRVSALVVLRVAEPQKRIKLTA
jgi:hypothetical protein